MLNAYGGYVRKNFKCFHAELLKQETFVQSSMAVQRNCPMNIFELQADSVGRAHIDRVLLLSDRTLLSTSWESGIMMAAVTLKSSDLIGSHGSDFLFRQIFANKYTPISYVDQAQKPRFMNDHRSSIIGHAVMLCGIYKSGTTA